MKLLQSNFIVKLYHKSYFKLRNTSQGRHSSMGLSAPSIMRSRVRISSTPSTLFHFIVTFCCIFIFKQIQAGFGSNKNERSTYVPLGCFSNMCRKTLSLYPIIGLKSGRLRLSNKIFLLLRKYFSFRCSLKIPEALIVRS